MTAMEIIRLTGGEFKNVDGAIIEKMIEIVRPMVSRKQFGGVTGDLAGFFLETAELAMFTGILVTCIGR